MNDLSKNKAILEKEELNQFVDFIKQEKLIREISKTNLIKILTQGYQDNAEKVFLTSMLSRVEDTIQNNKELSTDNPETQIELLKSCSKLSLFLALDREDTNSSKKDILEQKLLKGAMISNHDKIEKAIKLLYPEDGKHKAVLIGKIINLMGIFRSDDIIGILKHKLRVVSYHEKNKVEPAEYSILDGRSLKSYLLFRDRKQYNHLFTAGEDSLPALYAIFDIEASQELTNEIETAYTNHKLAKALKGKTDITEKIDEKIQNTLQDPAKVQELKNKIKELQEKHEELELLYKEDVLDKLANFQQKQNNSVLLKSLLPTKGFINWFKAQTNLPQYISNIFNKIKIQGESANSEELMILYIYFAQHHRIATSSITSVIDNLDALQTDTRSIQHKLSQEYLSILDVVEIINTAPNYYQEVEAKNKETLNNMEDKYNFSLRKTLITFWPLFLQSKNKYLVEDPELYAIYNQTLSRSEQKIIKDLLTKRSFNIPRDNKILLTEAQKMIDNIKDIEAISTLEKTIKQLIPLIRKFNYHSQGTKKPIANFTALLPKDKAEFKEEIKEETVKNTNHLAKNKYIITEELKNRTKHKHFPEDMSHFDTRIEETAITEEHKRLRDFLHNTEKKPYKQSALKNIQEEYKAGIISKKSIELIKTITEKLEKYQEVTQFNIENFKERLKLPHIVDFVNIKKTDIQENTYFHINQIKEIKKAKKVLDYFSRKLERSASSETTFMEQLMFIHEHTDKILLTPRDNFDVIIETVNTKTLETEIQETLITFNPTRVITLYHNLLTYKNVEEHKGLLTDFHQNIDKIKELSKTYNISVKHMKHIKDIISLLEADKNTLANPIIFKHIQNLIHLATDQTNLLDSKDKKDFAALKRQKHYTQYSKTPIKEIDINELEKNNKYKELNESLEKTLDIIIEKILEYSKKNTHVSGLIKGTTLRDKSKRRVRNYDPTLSLRTRNIKSFLGKINMKLFLLGQRDEYNVPQYIKNNLNDDKNIIENKSYMRFQNEINHIEKYINKNFVRL